MTKWYNRGGSGLVNQKKQGEVVTVDFVQFDNFNKEGKVSFEYAYGNFDKIVKE